MKTIIAVLLLAVVGNTIADAATINWTNTAGGNWSVAANWSPNQVPGAADTAVITNADNYTVTLDVGPTIGGLILGAVSGKQILSMNGQTFILNGAATISSQGQFNLDGTLAGNGTISGILTWTNGSISGGSTLTIATNGVLVLAGVNGTDYQQGGTLTNAGTIRLVSGNLALNTYNGGANGQLINLPGALVDIQTDGSIDSINYTGPGLMVNQGTVRKSGGTGTSTINPPLNNSGTLDVQTGTVSLNSSGSGNGVFEADAGATLKIVGGYTVNSGSQFIGAGTNSLSGGMLVTFNGIVTSSNAVLAGALLAGTNGVIVGTLSWTSGNIASGNTLTIATNGVLVLAGVNGTDYQQGGTLTNAGTIRLVSGNLALNTYNGGANGQLINLPGALVDIQTDGSIDSINYTGPGLMVNQGTVRKSGGTGTSTINPPLNNSGTLDVQTGTVSLNSSGSGNGVFEADTGATLKIVGGYTVNSGSQFIGAGTNSLSGGTLVTLNGSVTSSNAVLAGALLAGTNGVIVGTLSWTSGNIASGSTLTIATNGVLVLAGVNGTDYQQGGTLTNAGTIQLVSGNLALNTYNGGANGQLINLPGALVDIQTDGSIDSANYTGPGLMVNQGTVRKSGGTGTSTINPPLNNSGTLDVETGTLSLAGSHTLTGGTLNFGINSLTSYGKINLSGSAGLTGTVSANLNNGYVPTTSNLFTVLTYGSYTGTFTNMVFPPVVVWQTNYGPASFTISVLSINMLAFNAQPVGGALTNMILAPVVVQVENAGGNPIATNGVPVTVSLNSGSGTLSGTLTQNTDPTGKATFTDLSINLIGTKTLRASSSGLAPAMSTAFAIVPLIGTQWTNSGFVLQLNGTNSLGTTIIYASTNLMFWTPIYTNAPTNGPITFVDPASTIFPYRFYHILQE